MSRDQSICSVQLLAKCDQDFINVGQFEPFWGQIRQLQSKFLGLGPKFSERKCPELTILTGHVVIWIHCAKVGSVQNFVGFFENHASNQQKSCDI